MGSLVTLEGNSECKDGYDAKLSGFMPVGKGCVDKRSCTKLRCKNDDNLNNIHSSKRLVSSSCNSSERKEENPGRHLFLMLTYRVRQWFGT